MVVTAYKPNNKDVYARWYKIGQIIEIADEEGRTSYELIDLDGEIVEIIFYKEKLGTIVLS